MIDDEPAICQFVGTVGRKLGFEFEHTTDADEFRRLVREFAPTALVLDLNMPRVDGIELLREEHTVEGRHLTLEITEAATMKHPETAMDILTRLRIMDVKIALDDFGTGYSSLKQLFHMPFSELKIDGSFIIGIETSEEARMMVRTMIQIGHNLGLSVCAEAVQTREALEIMEAEGCDKVQGFYFSEPVDPAAFGDFVRKWPHDPALDAHFSSSEEKSLSPPSRVRYGVMPGSLAPSGLHRIAG